MTPHGKANHRTHTQPPLVLAYSSYPDGDHGNVQPESSSLRQSAERVSRDETGFARASRVRHFGMHTQVQLTCLAARLGARDEKFPVQFVALRGGVSWGSNQQHGARCRQIAKGANMRPKKSAPWTGEYPSATSQNSRCPARRSNSSSIARAAMPPRPSAGYQVTAGRRQLPSMRSAPTSSLGSNDRRTA